MGQGVCDDKHETEENLSVGNMDVSAHGFMLDSVMQMLTATIRSSKAEGGSSKPVTQLVRKD